jgi:hypothetical protein
MYTPHISQTWTPILPVSRQFQVGRGKSNQVLRKQFPLRHSAAKTVHRSQGDTLDQVVLDFTSRRKQPHTHYVGLSRVRSLDGLFIKNLCEDRIHVSDSVRAEMAALRSDRRMRLTLRFPYMIEDSSLKISFLNVRSLPKHTEDIKLDRSLMTCDLCIFCETRLMLHDVSDTNHPYNLPGYGLSVFEGIVSDNQRSHYGLVVYSRCPLSYCSQVTRMRSPQQTVARATHLQSCYVATGRKSSLSHPEFDVAAPNGAPTSTQLGEGIPAHRNPRVHDRGSRHATRKTTQSIAQWLPNGRPSEVAGGDPVQKTRRVETFPTTPRSPFLPTG